MHDPDAEFYEDEDDVEVIFTPPARWGFEVIFEDDEFERLLRMRGDSVGGKFSVFIHDLAMRALAEWEADEAERPAPVTAAD